MTDRHEHAEDQNNKFGLAGKAQRIKTEASNLNNTLSDSFEGIKEYARESGHRMQNLVKDIRAHANDSVDTLEKKIRARPLLTASAAFVVGMLASKLIASRK